MAELVPSLVPDRIRAALDRVLVSADFDASERNRSFLRHVVEETLAGRAERIKAYNIATSVFGRDDRFDPQLDSIVRIEAGRLRRSLERYYLTSGRDDPVRIGVPKGSYVPTFAECETEPAVPAGPAIRTAPGPALLVAAFDEEGDAAAFPGFTRGFVRALVIALTRFSALRVFDAESARLPGASGHALRPEPGIDYILTGGTTVGPDHFEVDVMLVEAHTGRSIWGDSLQRSLQPAEIIAARNEVANQVVRTLAQPYGIIYSARARDAEGAPPESLGSYGCMLRFYRYWRTFDRDQLEPVRACLERTILAEPEYSEAFACLSLVYSNARRFAHPHAGAVDAEGARTLALARQAVALAPGSSWAQYALALAYWFSGDVGRGLEALETGRALNPERHDDHRRPRAALRHACRLGPGGAAPRRGLRAQPGAAGQLSYRHVPLSLRSRAFRGGARRGARRRLRARGLRLDRHRRGRGEARACRGGLRRHRCHPCDRPAVR